MEDFYFYSSVVALVILIVILTLLGITISYGNTTKRYPRNASQCPDYWTADGDYCLYPLPDADANRGSSEYNIFTDTAATDDDIDILRALGSVATNGATSYSGTSFNPDNLRTVKSGNGRLAVRLNNNDASWNSLFTGLTPRCGKRKWALESGIVWDGITNYNGCGDPAN